MNPNPSMRTHIAMLVTACAVSYALCAASALTQTAPAAITTEQLCDALSAQLESIEQKRVTFGLDYTAGSGAHEPPTGKPQPDEVGPTYECASTIAEGGKRYRYEQHYLSAPDSLKEFVGRTEIMTWDGAQARQATILPNNEGLSGTIEAQPPMSHYMEPYSTWQGWWVLQYRERRSYGDLLKNQRCSGPRLREDGKTEWTYTYEESPLVEVSLVAARGSSGRVSLEMVQFRSHAEIDRVKTLTVSLTVDFGPPAEELGTSLPRTAVMTWRHYRPDPKDEFWQVCKIEMKSVAKMQPDDETFRIGFKPPMTVADTRYRIGYKLGDTKLNLDGRLVVTAIPMEGDVGDRLEWWVEHGRPAPVPESPASATSLPSEGSKENE